MATLLRDPFRTSRWTDAVLAIVVIGLFTLLLLAVFSSPHSHVRENAKRAACKNNLRQIVIACRLYADDNDGRFPDTFQQLYPTFADNAKVFSCPSTPSSYTDFVSGTATEKSSSYTLVPGLRADMPGDFILACDSSQENNHGDGRNAVSVDGSVEWLKLRPGSPEEAAFQKRLAEQAEKVKAWKPPATAAGGVKQEGKP